MSEERPTAATVFGVLNIVFGGLGVAGTFINALIMALTGGGQNPVYELVERNSLFAAWTYGNMVIGFFVAILLIVAGIGLLKVKPWGRTISIGYGIYGIIMSVIGTIIGFTVVLPAMAEQGGPAAAAARTGVLVGSATGFIYPLLVLIFMLRSNMKAAFRPEEGELPRSYIRR